MIDSTQPASVAKDLYRKCRASEFGLSKAEFAKALAEAANKYLSGTESPTEHAKFCESLRLEELALARACALGRNKAWEVFLSRYRAKLYDMAGAIARDNSIARELADSLYAELYGTKSREKHRISKLAYYLGKGSLEGWLRTVIAQEFVNSYRAQKRLVSLEEQEEQGRQFADSSPEPLPIADARVEHATDEALASLPAEDRFVLAAYFLDGRTLAVVARVLNVHESTISRKVDKLTRQLRNSIIRRLTEQGMDRRTALEAMDSDVRGMAVDVRLRLAQGAAGAAFNGEKSG